MNYFDDIRDAPAVPHWRTGLLRAVRKRQNEDGGWGYGAGRDSAPEPTALAMLALGAAADEAANERWEQELTRAGRWLAGAQREAGELPAVVGADAPGWPTAHAVLAWCRADASAWRTEITRAASWLREARGERAPDSQAYAEHSTTLVGWSWVAGTHSWVEPTAWACLALSAAGFGEHARCVAGRALLRDRALPAGGWNYGNAVVLGNELRPFPATTGVALVALAGTEGGAPVEAALAYLARALVEIRAPLSLGWGLLGLTAWGRRPAEADDWLEAAVRGVSAEELSTPELALLLLADARRRGVETLTGGRADG